MDLLRIISSHTEKLLFLIITGCALFFHGYPVDWLLPVVLVLVAMLLRGIRVTQCPVSLLHGVCFFALLLLFFSSFWSGNPDASEVTAWRLSAAVWCFFLLSHRECDKTVLFSISLSALCAALLGLVEYWQTLTRVTSLFSDPNVLSAVMYVASFVGLYYWVSSTRQDSCRPGKATMACFWAGQLLLLLTLFATDSRGGLIAWSIGVVGLLILNAVTGAGHARLLKQYCLISFIAWSAITILPRLLNLDAPARYYGDLVSLNGRLPIWQASLHLFANAPWLGNGLGTFHDLYPSVRTELMTGGNQVHNDYIELLVEGGIVLLSLFCSWLVLHLWLLLKVLLRGAKGGCSGFALGILLSCNLMLFLHAAANFIVYVLWLNLAMGMVFALICRIAWQEGYLKPPQWHVIPKFYNWCGGFALLFITAPFTLSATGMFLFDSTRERPQWVVKLTGDLSAHAVILMLSPSNQTATIDLMNRLKVAMEQSNDRQIQHRIFRQIWIMVKMLREDAPFKARNHLIAAQLIDYAEANDIPLPEDAETFEQAWEKAVTLNPGYLQAHVVKAKRIEREDADAAFRLLIGIGQGWFQFAPEKQVQDYLQMLQHLMVRQSLQRDS
ncbi:MAG: hypothetical protein B0D91_08415 [Oceanospirillales bacterium LUC14_002_19_P2]|nr:MAG: hypothetical protein B0D91_08415 [Oceanospirillales bacterium LUC14_002_19_P2]